MALNSFSVVVIDDGDVSFTEALGIDEDRATELKALAEKAINKWYEKGGALRYSELCEGITEHCQNPNEAAYVVGAVFYEMGLKDAGGGVTMVIGRRGG